ncbi:MAG TPA: PRC-barrel domain-containing protein [Casimicrobiaceae bacterium]|nr:PRC-barrel domain-containing protein [Casimicrobiaceae bacterium]
MGTRTTSTTRNTSAGAAIVGNRGTSDGPGPEVMDAATLIGDAVVNANDEDLGKVEAIMLDVQSGRIAYAVLSFGGFMGMGTKLFAIPWSALTLDTEEKRFILDVPKEKLENAPGFDKDHWPAMADQRWATDLHTYYDVAPYWEDELSATTTRDPRTSAGAATKDKTAY